MSDSSIPLDELLDLKLLPAWVNERTLSEHPPDSADEERSGNASVSSAGRHGKRKRRAAKPERFRKHGSEHSAFRSDKQSRRNRSPEPARLSSKTAKLSRARDERHQQQQRLPDGRETDPNELSSRIRVHFLPHPPACESVIAQIRQNVVAYSVFALARLFLAKPERYNVRLTADPESPLFQIGESGAISFDRQLLERDAFRLMQSSFYHIEVTQSEPIKGNFTNVARCKLSRTLLGPTNHHDYQKRLRTLFEQRFSRRMTFPQYQREIEIIADPALVEQWKEDARKITTYSTLNSEPAQTFASPREAERHFRENHLPGLLRTTTDLTIDGPTSRRLFDRALRRLVETEWSRAIRSPSDMLQELAGQFRQAGLHIFRHRRGMLFVSPIRAKPFIHTGAEVSPSVKAIIEVVARGFRISRKELADTLIANLTGDDQERAKLALASDLHWLIREGYVIEFNDGSLDLPRVKTPKLGTEKGSEIVAGVITNAEESDLPVGPPIGLAAETAPTLGREQAATTAQSPTTFNEGIELPTP